MLLCGRDGRASGTRCATTCGSNAFSGGGSERLALRLLLRAGLSGSGLRLRLSWRLSGTRRVGRALGRHWIEWPLRGIDRGSAGGRALLCRCGRHVLDSAGLGGSGLLGCSLVSGSGGRSGWRGLLVDRCAGYRLLRLLRRLREGSSGFADAAQSEREKGGQRPRE
jgi:hypothetical protein